jgi:peptidoglycan/xylan/chitin deacetylase (PgdA/CDA1 family)
MTTRKRNGRPKRTQGPQRDFLGYGPNPPHPQWPGRARIAVNLNLNFEAGGERSVLEGDDTSEDVLNDIGFPAYKGVRSPIVETVFEYGPRVGTWRLLRIFKQFDIKVSVLAVVRSLQQCPEAAAAFLEHSHEIVSHGWRWIDYHMMDEATEREHIRLAVAGLKALTGSAPVGWFNGRPSANTRRLLVEAGGFLYDRDGPQWTDDSWPRNERSEPRFPAGIEGHRGSHVFGRRGRASV